MSSHLIGVQQIPKISIYACVIPVIKGNHFGEYSLYTIVKIFLKKIDYLTNFTVKILNIYQSR